MSPPQPGSSWCLEAHRLCLSQTVKELGSYHCSWECQTILSSQQPCILPPNWHRQCVGYAQERLRPWRGVLSSALETPFPPGENLLPQMLPRGGQGNQGLKMRDVHQDLKDSPRARHRERVPEAQ